MDTAFPRVQSRVFSTALLAAALVVGCGDDAGDPSGTPFPPTTVGANPTVTPGQTGGGGLPPVTGNPQGTNPLPGFDAGTPQATNPPPAGGTDSAWCKVKAILDKNCIACHTTPLAAGAPFPLEKYADLTAASPTKAGKKIFERVGVRIHADKAQAESLTSMPPGKQLAAADLATIDGWVAAGAPAGSNPTCAGATGSTTPDGGVLSTDETWPLPECDGVYKITSHGSGSNTAPYMVPPGQEVHPQMAWDAPWGSDKVQAIAFRAITDNKAVLHHWILSGRPGGFLSGWAPGEDGVKKMLPDVGMEMPSGAGSLNLDMHYNSLQQSKSMPDNSGVEVCVVKEPHFRKNHAAVTMGLVGIPIIPGNSVNYEIKSSCTVSGTTPVTLLSASPHAHKLAVRMLFTLQKKGGQLITMHDMPFMFGEQHSYKLDPPIVVESGDVINTSCFYTNPSSATVTFGENTGDEMCFNFALYYPSGSLNCGGGGGFLGGDSGGFFSF